MFQLQRINAVAAIRAEGVPEKEAEGSTGIPVGPFTVRVELTEQPFLPTNQMVLTLADAFAASRGELSELLSLNAVKGLGLDREAQLREIEEQARLEIAALRTKAAFETADSELKALPEGTPERCRRVRPQRGREEPR